MSNPIQPGAVISYMEMCSAVGASLQSGMNFRLRGDDTIVLMSQRLGAPYADRVEDEGRVLIYEGHDAKNDGKTNPKELDQPEFRPSGLPTQNGRFAEAVRRHKEGAPPEKVKVYEKVQPGIWVYNGSFDLVDYWIEEPAGRKVFKFKLTFSGTDEHYRSTIAPAGLDDDRLIPSWVKLEVWKRDKGRCQKCEANSGLHFDHIIPYSKGGSSKDPANIQILCGRHNLAKRDNIE